MTRLWSVFIVLLSCFLYGQTQATATRELDSLQIDQAYLTIKNKNHSDAVILMFNRVVCEHCDLLPIADPVPFNGSTKIHIDTRYPYDFQLVGEKHNQTVLCQLGSYQFAEHSSYVFEVIQLDGNKTSCSMKETGTRSYFWTPIIVGSLLLLSFILVIQLARRFHSSRYLGRLLTNIGHERLVNEDVLVIPPPTSSSDILRDDGLGALSSNSELPLVGSTRLSNNTVRITKVLPKRLRSLDTFRGFSLMVMIFVNYGGGGYWFFDHSTWNGLTLADLVFPWFTWMMGVSIVLSQRSLRAKNVRRLRIFAKITQRTVILFLLGLILQGGGGRPKNLRIFGVLQRLALCYFFTAVIVLVISPDEDEPHSSPWPIGDDVHQPMRAELWNTVFHYWAQWLCVLLITLAWILITFVPKLEDCPRGYVGPGGRHEHGQYTNCTGGMAGYVDRLILGSSHLYGGPTCKEIYDTKIPYDPEGLLGILTGILLCYLGTQAGHSFAHSTSVRRVCAQWLVSGVICGAIALILSKGGHSESWVPINKNLWSLSFVLVLASLAFFILTVLYLLVDVWKVFTGEPWLWLGMNSIVLYVGHEICSSAFPVQFEVDNTHVKRLAMHAYGVTFWMIVAGIMYFKKVFIAI